MHKGAFFTILDRVDSTNNYAMQRVHDGMAMHGQAWFANEQTAGKGQRGNSWAGEKGKNIAITIVLEPEACKLTNQFHLSAMVALSCFELLKKYAGDEVKIKWPNDLYWRDRKAGGILIENKLQGKKWKWAVVGIGININQNHFDEGLLNPVSLNQVTGKVYDVIELAKELQRGLIKNLEKWNDLDKTMRLYNEQLYKRDKPVTLKKGNIKFDTVIKGVSADGKLITLDAIEREFDFGEVQWVL